MGLAGLAALLVVTVLVLTSSLFDQPTPQVVRYSVPVGRDADVYLGTSFGNALAFSPDGNLLVYNAPWGGVGRHLWMQRLGQERAEPIEGTEGAIIPFFSPDGDWIGFTVGAELDAPNGSLMRVSVDGGEVERIAPLAANGVTWGDDGTIVYFTHPCMTVHSGEAPRRAGKPIAHAARSPHSCFILSRTPSLRHPTERFSVEQEFTRSCPLRWTVANRRSSGARTRKTPPDVKPSGARVLTSRRGAAMPVHGRRPLGG